MEHLRNHKVQLVSFFIFSIFFLAVAVFSKEYLGPKAEVQNTKVAAIKDVPEKQEIKIHIFSDPVYITSNNSSSEALLKEDQIVPPGSTVRTGETGRAELRYPNESVTRLDFDTSVKVKTFINEPHMSLVELLQGSIWNRVSKLLGNDSFVTETGSMVATVRGTGYAMSVEGSENEVMVKAGKVDVLWEGKTKPVVIPGNTQIIYNVATKATPRIETLDLSSNKDAWVSFNIEEDKKLMKQKPEKFIKDEDESVLGASTQVNKNITKVSCSGADGISFLATKTDCDTLKSFWVTVTPKPTLSLAPPTNIPNKANPTTAQTVKGAVDKVVNTVVPTRKPSQAAANRIPTVVPTVVQRVVTSVPTIPPVFPTMTSAPTAAPNQTNTNGDNGNKNGHFEVFTNCIKMEGSTMTAYFGYDNRKDVLNLNLSTFEGGSGSAPTTLESGRHDRAATATTTGTQITWKANGNSATATTSSPACQ